MIRMIDSIICMGANAFRVYLISRFMKVFFKPEKTGSRTIILAYGIFYAADTFLYLILHTAFINIVCDFVGVFLLTLLYPAQIRMKLFVTVIIYAINMACEIIVVQLFVKNQNKDLFDQIYQAIIVLLLFVCEIVIERLLAYREKKNMHSFFLLIIPICSILMLRYMTKEHTSIDSDAVIASIGVLVMNFCVFYFYHVSIKSFSEKYENTMLRQNLKAYVSQLEVISKSTAHIKALRHDMKHHMNEIQILAGKNDVEGIRRCRDRQPVKLHAGAGQKGTDICPDRSAPVGHQPSFF